MKVIKYHKSSFERQIHESVMIQASRAKHNIMNSRSEYNRCTVPRLGVKMGSRAVKEKEEEQELILEQELEERISKMRKTRKAPKNSKEGPRAKKLKLSSPNKENEPPLLKRKREEDDRGDSGKRRKGGMTSGNIYRR